MSLSDEQWKFLRDVASLVKWAEGQGMKLTPKDLLRTEFQQMKYMREGKTRTFKSKHLKGLAIDLVLFHGGEPSWKAEDYRPLGERWEALSPENRWGGNFKGFVDAVHFERNA